MMNLPTKESFLNDKLINAVMDAKGCDRASAVAHLEDKYFWAVDYFRKSVGAEVIFPMHFWGRFDVCEMLTELGFENIMRITKENESFEI